MDFEVEALNGVYRGSIPFYLKRKREENKKIIYLTSSEKNMEDYYYSYLMFYGNKNVYKIGIDSFDEREKKWKNSHIYEIMEKNEEYIIFLNIELVIEGFYKNFQHFQIKKENIYSFSEIEIFLESGGYIKEYMISKKGEYSRRGDIFDIYPINEENPIRIEFFGDRVENIRNFDIETQKSIDKRDEISIYTECSEKDKTGSTEKTIKDSGIKVFIENKELINFKIEEKIQKNREKEEELRENFEAFLNNSEHIELKRFENSEIEKFKNYEEVKKYSEKNRVVVLSDEEKRYKEIFGKYKNIEIMKYPHYEGFKNSKEVVLTDRELKGIVIRRAERRKESLKYKNISQIRKNDFIIHENYGVGIYSGIEAINGKDYLKLKYADEDNLYVPIEHINRVERFITEPGATPEIYNLGKKGFKKTKEKLKKDIEAFAKEIVEIQAAREKGYGFSFSKDTVWQEEFEEGFPYTETPDQMKAINDVKRDMESYKPMDRVICGDVGYGKTEVAMRAAFKCVMDGKQVAFLAPTTILVNQHYERFKERFKNFPVEIDMISRLEKDKSQNLILNKLSEGVIDIIIGTHRILQKDVKFKDLGVIIIDEEQKFGVKAKESLKKYRSSVDIITMSATPIPRTLNMAMLGIKDISIIDTPPENRLPVEINILTRTEKNIREAVLKEISRDGQVYYVYNNVTGMKIKFSELSKILPKYVKMTYIHGQMESYEIKERIDSFQNGEYDLLLSTTIIENGLDIENANSIIIENFDRLGLSQIHQLRGRVGRGNKKGYCYLVNEEGKKSSKKGEMKIDTIEEMQDLGAGFQLSLEDMRIRGAGEILGEKQHGTIEHFGYDFYMKMLHEEMERQKGNKVEESKDITLEIDLKGYIPSEYVEESEKLKIYRRMIMINSIKELEELKEEINDRFGNMPEETSKLFLFYKIKILSKEKGIKNITEGSGGYFIKLSEETADIDKIQNLIISGEVKYIQSEKKLFTKGNIEKIIQKL